VCLLKYKSKIEPSCASLFIYASIAFESFQNTLLFDFLNFQTRLQFFSNMFQNHQ